MPGADAPAFAGSLPNVFYRAVTLETLRLSPEVFHALPAEAEEADDSTVVTLGVPSSYRYLRQEDALWDALHSGMLTSGFVAAALGFFEAGAVSRLKMPKSRASHGRLLEAYSHLIQPPFNPTAWKNNINGAEATATATATATAIAAEEAPGSHQTAAAPLLAALRPQKKKKGRRKRTNRMGPSQPQLQPPISTAAYAAAAHAAGVAASDEARARVVRSVGCRGLEAVRCAWGRAQEGAALRTLGGCVFKKSRVCEVGLCVLGEESWGQLREWGFDPGALPMLGSSPDALVEHRGGFEEESGNGDGVGGESVGIEAVDAVARLDVQSGSSSSGSSGSGSGINSRGGEGWCEAVEVKCTCPFDYSKKKGGNGGGGKKWRYVVCDRGPRHAVDVAWVPQLQLHMLCSNTQSALVVSRSATHGTRVFRLKKDERFLRLMLSVLTRLWTAHVLPRCPPPRDAFADLPEHQALLKRAREVAGGAEVVAEVSGEEAAEEEAQAGRDQRFFLD